jgi:hypothetical protein
LPKAPPEAFYDLMYEAQPVDCGGSYGVPVEVWNFTAAGPYDRTDMVVTQGSEVSLSRGHSAQLRRDLCAALPQADSQRSFR